MSSPGSTASAVVPLLTDFNPHTTAFRDDPYPEYRRIRELGGPARWEYLDAYLVASHADATAVLADPSIRVQPPAEVAEMLAAVIPPDLMAMQRTLLFRDPPDHTRLRSLTRRAFAPGALDVVLREAATTAARILDRAAADGHFELVEDFAFPVSLQVIGDLLGVPREDLPALRDWGQAMSPAADFPPSPAAVEQAMEAYLRFDEYFARLAGRRRRQPGHDLFSDLVRAQQAGTLSIAELHANATLVFISGHETLVAFMASAVLTLLRNPAQLDLLRNHPELAPGAVEEVLRYESPLQLATAGGGRWTTTDVEIAGRVIPAGERVLTLVAAANRDPAVYPEPDRFDITRRGYRHLALGHGLHYCLGAALAKLQGELVLEHFARWPFDVTMTQPPRWIPLFMQRRLIDLPLTVTPR
ncbi:MAG TPA: cytochrome P450 [Kineosporiaceae bacterium]|nr:cytochrome P450 [Kineosporiaceae bacterium]